MKKNVFMLVFMTVFILLISAYIVFGLDECGFSIFENTKCSIVTPYISFCDKYEANVTYLNGTFYNNYTLGQIDQSGIYNFTINFTYPTTYVIKLCDDSSRTVVAINQSATGPSASLWSYLLQIYYNTLPGAW